MQTTDSVRTIKLLEEIEVPCNLSFLIVEDEKDIQELLKDSIIDLGFEGAITTCDSAESALELAKERAEGTGPVGAFALYN